MITTGSKWFFGLGFVSLVLAAAYGWTTGGNGARPAHRRLQGRRRRPLRLRRPGHRRVRQPVPRGRCRWPSRDAEAEAVAQVAGTETVPPVIPAAPSYWPAVAAFGVALVVIGLVSRPVALRLRPGRPRRRARRVGGAGLGRPCHRRSRDQPPHPQPPDEPHRVPRRRRAGASAVVAAAFSRLFLSLSADGAVWVGIGIAAAIVVVGFFCRLPPPDQRQRHRGRPAGRPPWW